MGVLHIKACAQSTIGVLSQMRLFCRSICYQKFSGHKKVAAQWFKIALKDCLHVGGYLNIQYADYAQNMAANDVKHDLQQIKKNSLNFVKNLRCNFQADRKNITPEFTAVSWLGDDEKNLWALTKIFR